VKNFGIALLCLLFVAGGVLMGAFGFGASVGWIPFVLGITILSLGLILSDEDISDGVYLFSSLCLLVGGVAMAVFGLPVAWLPTLIGFGGTLRIIISMWGS
jgi:hypothetical protein